MADVCTHLDEAAQTRDHPVHPSAKGCEDCLATGGSWVHLRLCLTCGHVGCCDSSPGRHATKHFHATQHPVVKSFEPDEAWAWCFVDRQMMDPFLDVYPEETPSRHYEMPYL